MTTLLRYFFYAVGCTALLYMYQVDASAVTFGDFIRLVQSHNAQHLVWTIFAILLGLEWATSIDWMPLLPHRRRAGIEQPGIDGPLSK